MRCEREERGLVITPEALGISGECTLRGIAASSLAVETQDRRGFLRYLRIAESPGLRALDLSACTPDFELQLDSVTAPEEIVLPEGGARLFLSVREGIPAIRISGRVLEVVIECMGGHPTAGTFLLDASDGLALLPGDELVPERGIERYLRLDQSQRGLQYKSLRRGVAPEGILWKLADAKAAEHAVIDRITRGLPHALSCFALGTSAAARAERREWLDNVVRPESLCAHLERALLRGAPPLAIWALRCMLQRASCGDPNAETVGHALLSAGAGWKTARGSLWPPKCIADDLFLILQLRTSVPARRCERRLVHTAGLSMLEPLMEVVARLPGSHPWLDALQGLTAASIERGGTVLAKPAEDRTREEWREANSVDRDTPTFLRRLIQQMDAVAHHRLVAQLIRFANDVLSVNDRMRLGLGLHSRGSPVGRTLVVNVLQSGGDFSPGLRAEAARCLLGNDVPV